MSQSNGEELQKKRGRRKKMVEKENKKEAIQIKSLSQTKPQAMSINKNIILNLLCSIEEIDAHIREEQWKVNELTYNPDVPKEIIPFDNDNNEFHVIEKEEKTAYNANMICPKCDKELCLPAKNKVVEEWTDEDTQKIKELKLQFYRNEIPDKKVDCFWCTYSYDNDPYYILQQGSNGDIMAHCSFCSPPCAVAFLFNNMHWDDSAKMESYQLMNYYYNSKSHENSIKPACSPYYFLDKYYGNMTIQEYRKMSNFNYMFLCVDKPVTRVLPEIHEDNEKQSSNMGNYKVKKQSERIGGTNRNDILKSNFGIGQTST
jgi:hypothetical protein